MLCISHKQAMYSFKQAVEAQGKNEASVHSQIKSVQLAWRTIVVNGTL